MRQEGKKCCLPKIVSNKVDSIVQKDGILNASLLQIITELVPLFYIEHIKKRVCIPIHTRNRLANLHRLALVLLLSIALSSKRYYENTSSGRLSKKYFNSELFCNRVMTRLYSSCLRLCIICEVSSCCLVSP